jgi:hypothetical protein
MTNAVRSAPDRCSTFTLNRRQSRFKDLFGLSECLKLPAKLPIFVNTDMQPLRGADAARIVDLCRRGRADQGPRRSVVLAARRPHVSYRPIDDKPGFLTSIRLTNG